MVPTIDVQTITICPSSNGRNGSWGGEERITMFFRNGIRRAAIGTSLVSASLDFFARPRALMVSWEQKKATRIAHPIMTNSIKRGHPHFPNGCISLIIRV